MPAPTQTLSIDELVVSGVEIIGPAERFEASLRTELTRLFGQPSAPIGAGRGDIEIAGRQLTLRGSSRLSADAAGVAVARALHASITGDSR
jgi:hypothetical protein